MLYSLRLMFVFIPLFVDFLHHLTFWNHKIQIEILMHKSVDYFVCCTFIYHCDLDQAQFHHITQLLCYCEKDNLCSLLDSGRKAGNFVDGQNNSKYHVVAHLKVSNRPFATVGHVTDNFQTFSCS